MGTHLRVEPQLCISPWAVQTLCNSCLCLCAYCNVNYHVFLTPSNSHLMYFIHSFQEDFSSCFGPWWSLLPLSPTHVIPKYWGKQETWSFRGVIMRLKIPEGRCMPSNRKCTPQFQTQLLHLGVHVGCTAVQVNEPRLISFNTSNMEWLGMEREN